MAPINIPPKIEFPDGGEEELPAANWAENLMNNVFRNEDVLEPDYSPLFEDRPSIKLRQKNSTWTGPETNLLYQLFFARFEDWRPMDTQPAIRSMKKKRFMNYLSSEMIKAGFDDPPKTIVQIDDKLKNDFKKIKERIVNEAKGKPAPDPLPHPLCIFEEMVRKDDKKMELLKIRYLDAPNDSVTSSNCVMLDDDSREGSVDGPSRMGRDDDTLDIEQILTNSRAFQPPMPKKSRNSEYLPPQSENISTSTPILAVTGKRGNRCASEKRGSNGDRGETNRNLESLYEEQTRKTIQDQQLANEMQKGSLIDHEKMLMNLQEEVLHAKLEAARAKRRYYEKKTQLLCSSNLGYKLEG